MEYLQEIHKTPTTDPHKGHFSSKTMLNEHTDTVSKLNTGINVILQEQKQALK